MQVNSEIILAVQAIVSQTDIDQLDHEEVSLNVNGVTRVAYIFRGIDQEEKLNRAISELIQNNRIPVATGTFNQASYIVL